MARIKERRRHRRIYVALPINFTYNHEQISGLTKNISVLGTYLEMDRPLPVGVVLNVRLRISQPSRTKTVKTKQKQISCAGIIFRCQPVSTPASTVQYGIGIFFRAFLKGGEQELAKYIDNVLLQEQKAGKIYIRNRKQKQAKRRRKK